MPKVPRNAVKRKVARPAIPDALRYFDALPDSATVRLPVVCGLRSESPSTVWRRVADGTLPAPERLGPRTVGWNVGKLRAALRATPSSRAPREAAQRASRTLGSVTSES